MRDEEDDPVLLQRRMTAVRAVRQVVHALWALSRAQLPHVERATESAREYRRWVDRVLERVSGPPVPGVRRQGFAVVLGPERPYCGGLPRVILAQIPEGVPLGLVGRRLREIAEGSPSLRARVVFSLPGAVAHDEHETVGHAVAEAVLQHARGAAVDLYYPRPGGALSRAVLLAESHSPSPDPPETYSPLRTVLDSALAEALSARLTVAVAQTLHAEVLARSAAAERAVSACDRKLTEMEGAYRVARHRQITGELLEVVAGSEAAGAAALSGGGRAELAR